MRRTLFEILVVEKGPSNEMESHINVDGLLLN